MVSADDGADKANEKKCKPKYRTAHCHYSVFAEKRRKIYGAEQHNEDYYNCFVGFFLEKISDCALRYQKKKNNYIECRS